MKVIKKENLEKQKALKNFIGRIKKNLRFFIQKKDINQMFFSKNILKKMFTQCKWAKDLFPICRSLTGRQQTYNKIF